MSSGGHGGGGLPFLSTITNLTHGAHEGGGLHITLKQILIAFAAEIIAFTILDPYQMFENIGFLIFFAPLWMPLLLGRFAIARWVEANRVSWLAKQEYVLLEIRLPRDIHKSPLAMEMFFANLHLSPGESTWYKKYFNGAVRPWWSLEIVSLGGRVHFYIWTRASFRRGIESFLYAQYPDIEVVEATDYSLLTDPAHHPNAMWGCEYEFKKEDPYPIKTYAEFLKPDMPLAKPEEQIDPLAQTLELLGSVGPKEQFWLQIMIRVSKNEKYAGRTTKDGKPYSWKDEALDIIEGIREKTAKKGSYIDPITGKEHETQGFPNPTKGQSDLMASVDRKVSKQGFDVGIRAIYTAPEDAFHGSMISYMIGLFKSVSSESANSIVAASRWSAIFNDWPWEDPGGHHKAHLHHELVDAYRRRAYFYEPYRMPWMIMNIEELATLYHIPSSGVSTPSLPRIQSATTGAPSNLPT